MCEQCLAKIESYLTPLPGWTLLRATSTGDAMKKGDWGLVSSAGTTPEFIWKVTPFPEPDPDSSEYSAEQDSIWFSIISRFRRAVIGEPEMGWRLVESAKKVGFDPKNDVFTHWLFDHLGKWIRDKKPFDPNANFLEIFDNAVTHGFVLKQKPLKTGELYTLKKSNALGFSYVNACPLLEEPFKLPFNERVLLVETFKDNRVKILHKQKVYTTWVFFLSLENPQGEP